jgi:glyoxylase-like metal-dependent hydrolase (beta-lactamase superfamily II)
MCNTTAGAEQAQSKMGDIGPTDEYSVGTPDKIAPGVFFLKGGTRYFQEGTKDGPAGAVRSLMCNNGWIDLGDEVLLIDSNMPSRTDTLLAAVRETVGDKPIRYVVNTHHHGDHVYGNRRIREATGAAIIACTEMVEELQRFETGAFGGAPGRWEQVAKLRPDLGETSLLPPTITFDRSLVLNGRDRRVELHHFGWGHTRGDTVVWLPAERVVFAGDLVANGPFNIVRDGEMAAWPKFLAFMETLGPDVVCPGHGDRAGAGILTSQREFFVALLREVESRAHPGVTLEQLLGELNDIRQALLANPAAEEHVIPHGADLAVLSLRAQVERVFGQLANAS